LTIFEHLEASERCTTSNGLVAKARLIIELLWLVVLGVVGLLVSVVRLALQ